MDYKTSVNRTGTLFYTRYSSDASKYRVKFKSYHMAMFDNQEKIEDLTDLEKNYNLFKNGKCMPQKRLASAQVLPENNQEKKYKNRKQRVKESGQLNVRLKSMREKRKSLFQMIKSVKE